MATVIVAGGDPERVTESLPSYEGFVYDLPKRRKSREKHFVRLVHGKLYYYKDPLKKCEWSLSLRDTQVGRGNGSHSVQVVSLRRTATFFAKTQEEQRRWLSALHRCANWRLHDFYELGDAIGSKESKVQTCMHLNTKVVLAVKTVTRADRPPDLVFNEMAIISQPLHSNIIHAVDILESADNLYLVQEFMRGGSLYDFIRSLGRFTEHQARYTMKAILTGIQTLHENDIVHRDLKPENILVASLNWPIQLKLADFGLAGFVSKNNVLKSVPHFIGTVGYAAPEQYEIPAKRCGRAVDMWACGAILWNLLTATMPFPGDTRDTVVSKSRRGDYSFQSNVWKNVSEEAKDFIVRCFQTSIRKRITIEEALQHAWMIIGDEEKGSDTEGENEEETYEISSDEVNSKTSQEDNTVE